LKSTPLCKAINADFLPTFVGIKILESEYAKDKACWKLIVAKSKKFLVSALGLKSTKDVDSLIEKLEIESLVSSAI